MTPAQHRTACLEDFVGPVMAERIRIGRAADVVANAEAESRTAEETVASVALALDTTNLSARRYIARLSLDDAARKLRGLATYPGEDPPSLSPSRLARWEAGEERVSPRFLSAFCALYHVGPVDLGYRDHTPPDDH